MKKQINLPYRILKSFAISFVLITILEYFYRLELSLVVLLFCLLTIVLIRFFIKNASKPKNQNSTWLYAAIIIISIAYKAIFINFYSDKRIGNDLYILSKIGMNYREVIGDTMFYVFSTNTKKERIDNIGLFEDRIYRDDIISVYYQFRPFNRICISGISYDNEKDMLEQDSLGLGFGIRAVEFKDSSTIVIYADQKLTFRKTK